MLQPTSTNLCRDFYLLIAEGIFMHRKDVIEIRSGQKLVLLATTQRAHNIETMSIQRYCPILSPDEL